MKHFRFSIFPPSRRYGAAGDFRFLLFLLLIASHWPLATPANGQNVKITVGGAFTDRSGSITVGGTSQVLAAARPARTYIEIQNISDETLYVNFGADATIDNNSIKLVPGAVYYTPPNYCPVTSITIIGATTGKKFIAKEG